ncbi:MAG: hypothetical protein HY535_02245 [Chloroflexi bacterium]|nr:hypothetical protein [Chloroflexota bacterium]
MVERAFQHPPRKGGTIDWTLLKAVFVLALALMASACRQAGGESAYIELLKAVPDTKETRAYVALNDYEAVRQAYGVRPPRSNEGDDLLDYLLDLSGPLLESGGRWRPIGATWISGYGQAQYLEVRASPISRYVGFGIRDVTMDVQAGAPPGVFEAARGSFDPEETDRLLRRCRDCPKEALDRYEDREYQGVAIHSWGDGLQANLTLRLSPPVFDQLGRAKPLAVQKEWVFGTTSVTGLRAMIDAQQGRGRSLADREEFRLLAQGLSRLGAHTAFMSDQTTGLEDLASWLGTALGTEVAKEQLALLSKEPLLRPYRAYAMGAGKDEDGRYAVVVLVHATKGAASENVRLLPRRIREAKSLYSGQAWSSLIEDVEAEAEGLVLLAKLRGDRIHRAWAEVIARRDSLLLHE